MLSEQERREMKAMAQSQAVREEFERLKRASRLPPAHPINLDRLLNFLTTMSRFGPQAPPRPFPSYPNVRL